MPSVTAQGVAVHREPKSNLAHNTDTAQAFRCDGDATRSLESLGTTVSNPESQGKSGSVDPDDAWSWARARWLVSDPIDKLDASGPREARRTGFLSRPEGSTPSRSTDALHAATRIAAPITADEERAAWQADMEYVWRVRIADQIERLEARAKTLKRKARQLADDEEDRYQTSCEFTRQRRRRRQVERIRALRAMEWAEHRARALALPRADVVASCRKRWRSVRCGCGTMEFPVGCDNPQLCAWCRKRHWRKWRHRITRSMDIHLRAARARWNRYRDGKMLPGIYLVTLTGPHSGDIEQDRIALGRAWERLRKVAHAEQWWKTYALTWEVTKGESGTPHVHAHVAVISSWIPYEELHIAWRRAMPGALVLDVQAPNRTRSEAGRAANYLAKYVTKGIEPSELTGRKAGELLVAFRSRRKVTTSRHFWQHQKRECPKCGQMHQSVGAPCSLQAIAPASVLTAFAERIGVWLERGEPQVNLRWGTS